MSWKEKAMFQKAVGSFYLLLGVLILAALSLLIVDVDTSQSQVSSSSSFVTYTSTGESFNNFTLYVDGGDALSDSLEESLAGELSEKNFSVTTADQLPEDGATVVVEVTNSSVIYTPLYGDADMDIQVYFSTEGGEHYESLREGSSVEAEENGEDLVYGTVSFEQNTKGFLSLVAYNRVLSTNIAGETAEPIESVLG